MPWKIEQNAAGCRGFAVIKEDDGKLVGCHPSKSRALAHLKALYASEKMQKQVENNSDRH